MLEKKREAYRALMGEIEELAAVKDRTEDQETTLREKLDEADRSMTEIKNLEEADRRAQQLESHRSFLQSASSDPIIETPRVPASTRDTLQLQAFRSWIRGGERSLSPAQYRDLYQGSDAAGGYLNAPAVWGSELIKDLDAATFMRSEARVLPGLVGSDTLGFPVLDQGVSEGYWGTEIEDISASGARAMVFGKHEFRPALCTLHVAVSNKMLAITNFPVENLVREEVARALGETFENAYLNGDGADTGDGLKPLGIFTPSANGINTDRDVATKAAGKVAADDLLSLVYKVDPKWHAGSTLIVSPVMLEELRKFKDGQGRYLFTAGGQGDLAPGAAGSVNGIPVRVSSFAPANITTGQYVAAMCRLDRYWIVDIASVQLQRLAELKAFENKTVFLVRAYTTGAPVRPNAFARLKVS